MVFLVLQETDVYMDLSKSLLVNQNILNPNLDPMIILDTYRNLLQLQELYQYFNQNNEINTTNNNNGTNINEQEEFEKPCQQQEALDLSIRKIEPTNQLTKINARKFNQKIILKTDREHRKENVNVITCAMCKYTFLTMNQLNRHFGMYHEDFVIKYSYNLQHSRSKLTFQAHLASLRCLNQTKPIDKLQCPSCQYRAKWPTELEKHVMVHSYGRPFSCYICSKSYKWIWDLGRHFHKNHSQFDNPYRKTSRVKSKVV